MAAGSFIVYDVWKNEIGKGGGGMSSVTFYGVICSSGYTPSAANDLSGTGAVSFALSAVAGQLSATPHALTSQEWSNVGSNTYRFDTADATFTYSVATANKYFVVSRKSDGKLVCYCDLETGAGSGVDATKLIVQMPAGGLFSLA